MCVLHVTVVATDKLNTLQLIGGIVATMPRDGTESLFFGMNLAKFLNLYA
jgi:hypothetical protein